MFTKRDGLLNQPISSRFAYGLSLILALIFIHHTLSWQFFLGNSKVFDGYDSALHVAGWWMYVQDVWRFPLLESLRQNDFGGMNVGYTDGIPIAALLAKLFKNQLPAHFHYFGWWIGFVFITQALSATYLLRVLNARSFWATLIGVVFALCWPAMTHRMGHAALMTQSIIILGLGFYFQAKLNPSLANKYAHYLALLTAATVLIHPYFLPMLFGILVALWVDALIRQKQWRSVITSAVLCFSVLLFLMWILGFISQDNPGQIGGYGQNGMDLLAPICGRKAFLGCEYGFNDVVMWETTNYLGLGLMILIVWALALQWRSVFKPSRQFVMTHPMLILVLLGLFVYALANFIQFRGEFIWAYPLPKWIAPITNTFRAPGRFFWPVGYVILFVTLAWHLRRITWLALPVLLLCMVLQWQDTRVWTRLWRDWSHAPQETNYEQWRPLMAHVDKLTVIPSFQCGDKASLIFWTEVQKVAGFFGKALNSGPQARFLRQCDRFAQSLERTPKPRELIVMDAAEFANYPFDPKNPPSLLMRTLMQNGHCARHANALNLLCLQGADAAFWQQTGLTMEVIQWPAQERDWQVPASHRYAGSLKADGEYVPHTAPTDATWLNWVQVVPYINLAAGRYEATFSYTSPAAPQEALGHWYAVLQQPGQEAIARTLQQGVIEGSDGQVQTVTITFEIAPKETQYMWSVRSFVQSAEFRLQQLRLRRLQ